MELTCDQPHRKTIVDRALALAHALALAPV